MRKVKLAYRFGDLETAKEFIDQNKLLYDEIIVLFDTLVEEQQAQESEIPEQEINKDELILKLMKENEDFKKATEKTKEMPKPPSPIFSKAPEKKDKPSNMRIIQI